jgi:GTP-binding protein Era
MAHKSGFVNIIGYPNVGKSTLMNAMVGEKLSIITSKAQTTRHRIMGIVNGMDFQVVYSDTPGFIRNPSYKMHEIMNSYIDSALIDADILLLITEMGKGFEEIEIIEKLKSADAPILVLINKIDLSDQGKVITEMEEWQKKFPGSEIIPISASNKFNVEKVFDRIISLLPESPAYFDKDELTDRTERFFVSEIIREKILMNYEKEVPYSVEVSVESYQESKNLVKIAASITVNRDSQKAIILGHQGKSIKKTGTQARVDIEEFTGKKVFLDLSVKVDKDWRNNANSLKRFGYEQ